MNQYTLAQVRPALSQVSGMTGMSLSDERFIDRINFAQQEIINLGDFPSTVQRWHILFDEITGELVLPYYLDRLMQVTVDGVPSQIMSRYAEFVNYGAGPRDDTMFADSPNGFIPRCWNSDCLDRGEVVSRFPIPALDGPWVLRVYTTINETVDGVIPEINLQGYDPDGFLIRSLNDGTAGDWQSGISVPLDWTVPYVQTTQEFKNLTAVVKPTTNGYIRVTAFNGTTEVEISEYAPGQTTCTFRNYFIQSLWRQDQGVRNRVVLARARCRYIPVTKNNDVLIIGNIPALKAMLQSQWKRDAGSLDESEYYLNACVRILREEATAYSGKSRTPAISFTRGFAFGTIPFAH